MPPSSERMGIDLGMDAPVDQVREDVAFEKFAAGVVVLVRGRDQLRQPVRMRAPSSRFCRP